MTRLGTRFPRLVGAMTLLALAAPPSVAAASGANAGRVEVVSSADVGALPRNGGGSRTPFSLRLPSGSSCPGDSANDGYRVQSFIVPAAADVSTLTYRSVSPQVPGGYALYDVVTNPFIQAQTADARSPGQPGLIISIPNFSFAVFPPGHLPSGRYHVGIACSLHNDTVRYWATDLVVTTTPDDQPAHFRWRVADAPVTRRRGPSALALAGVAAVAGAAAVALWRRRSTGVTPLEDAGR